MAMPIELAVPEPVEGAGLLFNAIALFSNVQAVMTPACATGSSETLAMQLILASRAMFRKGFVIVNMTIATDCHGDATSPLQASYPR